MALAKKPAVIQLDEIVPGATVRFCVIDGVQYLSIQDFIMCVCGQNNKRACETWDNINQTFKDGFSEWIVTFQFPDRGQLDQPVITFMGALKLMLYLPGDTAQQHRSLMIDILRRYFAGDMSLFMAVTKQPAVIPMDEIVPGETVRFCVMGGVQYLFIRDFIMCVCGKNKERAREIWDNITQTRKDELSEWIRTFQYFDGGASHHLNQPIITFTGALKLMMYLPSDFNVKGNITLMIDILRRYFVGDMTLFNEIAKMASEVVISRRCQCSVCRGD
jgi:hypothetical protein